MTGDSVDVDGDSVLYTVSWEVDGSPFTGTPFTTVHSGDSISRGDTDYEQRWTCEVSPHDGHEDGGLAHAEVAIKACVYGAESACPGVSCLELLNREPTSPDGLYWIDPDGTGAMEAYCLMDHAYDGGGWTLIAVSSDDKQNSWTWKNRAYMTTDTTTFGSLAARNKDFKSPALHRLPAADMLFLHQPSGVWAGYNGVGNGGQTFADVVADEGPNCYDRNAKGVPLSSGTLSLSGKMCSTDLYFNSEDHDGRTNPTGPQCTHASYSDDTWGPAWSIKNNNGCVHDDPTVASLGPNASYPDSEVYEYYTGVAIKVGFGWALSLNTGTPGTAANYFQVYVRE